MKIPEKGKLLMTLAHGVELRELTPECIDYVIANLREGDRKEHEIVDPVADPDNLFIHCSCAVWHKENLVAMWRSGLVFGDGILSSRRAWGFFTTHHVDPVWRTFVRMTRPVYQAFWQLEAPWVDTVCLIPWAGYEKTIRWQERFLPQHKVMDIEINGERHIVYMIKRED